MQWWCTGGVSQYSGGVLGQFKFDEQKGYYQQTNTEQGHERFEAVYLYPDADDKWYVGSTPGKRRGWLRNPNPSKTLPTSGWQYAKEGTWQDDPTLTVTPGPLPPLAREFTVTATGAAAKKWPSYQGLFTRTVRWWAGRPVYTNTEGRFLYHAAGDWGWTIGDTLGKAALRGSQARHSPASEDNWKYWTGSEWKPANVRVTGL